MYGLFLENAQWDFERRCIAEQQPGQLSFAMPIIHFIPECHKKTAKKLEVGGLEIKNEDSE